MNKKMKWNEEIPADIKIEVLPAGNGRTNERHLDKKLSEVNPEHVKTTYVRTRGGVEIVSEKENEVFEGGSTFLDLARSSK